MGTNYYTKSGKHIGKMSPDIPYCPKCKCEVPIMNDDVSSDYCPHCATKLKVGYAFRWASKPEILNKIKKIVDEYGNIISKEEFLKHLKKCSVQNFDLIGVKFR